jgi:hypothetical protein
MVSPFKMADMLQDRNSSKVISDLLQWQNDVFDRILTKNPHLSPAAVKNSRTVQLNLLPLDEQIHQMGRYRDIIGLNDALVKLSGIDAGGTVPQHLVDSLGMSRAKGVHNIASNLRAIKGIDAEAPFFKFPTSYAPGGHALDAIYSGLNINFDTRVRDVRSGLLGSSSAANAGSHFGIGVNSINTISADYFNMSPQLKPGSKFLSFDIETAGLMKGQIREVGYRTGIIDNAGSLASGKANQLLFDPILLRRGTVGLSDVKGNINPVSISDFIRAGSSNPISDDFARSMVPFLQSMHESDYIIGHNISKFDIPQVLHQLTATSAYKATNQDVIPGFRNLVDSVFSNLDSKIVDTLTLAQRSENLIDISVHPRLLAQGKAQPYSISNLLLQTDLGEKIGSKDELQKLLSKGLHNAEVDDIVTRGLLQHLGNLQLKPMTDRGMIDSILSSAAITPMTKASLHTDISDKALKHLIANVSGGIEVPLGAGSPEGNSRLAQLLQQARSGNKQATKEAFDLIRSGSTSGLSFNITPIQQQVFETRRLGLGVPTELSRDFDPSSYIFRSNLFDDMAYGGKNKRPYEKLLLGQRDISADEFSAFQKKMKGLNMPFAGLSIEERRFGTALSHLTAGINPNATAVSSLLHDTMVGNFNAFEPLDVQYMTRSGRASLPISLLEKSGDLKAGNLLGVSAVDRTIYGGKSAVNLVYRFDSQDAANVFATKLEKLAQTREQEIASSLGMNLEVSNSLSDPDMLAAAKKFKDAVESGLPEHIRATGATQGISIGQLYDGQAKPVLEALRQLNGGMESLRDESMLPMKLPFMGSKSTESSIARGVVQTAGAVLDTGLTESDLGNIGKSVSHVSQVYGGLLSLGEDPKYGHALTAGIMAADHGEIGSKIIKDAFEGYQKVRTKIPKILGIAALAGFGIHEIERHIKNKPYNDLFQGQEGNDGTYNVSRLLQQKKDMGIDMSRQGYNPLSTAFVVDNLNSSKIGHTNMSSDKNTSLYGGVL